MLWPFFLKGYQDFFCITLTFPNEKLPFTPIHKKVTFDQLYLVPKIPQKFQVSRNLEWSFGLKGWPLMTTSFVGPFSAPFLDPACPRHSFSFGLVSCDLLK